MKRARIEINFAFERGARPESQNVASSCALEPQLKNYSGGGGGSSKHGANKLLLC
jgi:hypothetical protein